MSYVFVETDDYKDIQLNIVSGSLNNNLNELLEKKEKHSNIEIHNNVNYIRELVESCDLAISSGGTTVYELCFCGIPTILFSLADNQIKTVNSFSEKNIMLYVGDIRSDTFGTVKHIFDGISVFSKIETRKSISKMMQRLVDGNGVKRIVEILNAK